jgi:GDP-L-fucose synthase
VKLCQAYARQYGFNAIAVMPTNLYGPGDNFDLQNSHVLPALIRKFHEARQRGERETVTVGFNGELRFDSSKPDGTPRKVLDVSRLRELGWRPRVPLREGVMSSYRWFVEHQDSYRG